LIDPTIPEPIIITSWAGIQAKILQYLATQKSLQGNSFTKTALDAYLSEVSVIKFHWLQTSEKQTVCISNETNSQFQVLV